MQRPPCHEQRQAGGGGYIRTGSPQRARGPSRLEQRACLAGRGDLPWSLVNVHLSRILPCLPSVRLRSVGRRQVRTHPSHRLGGLPPSPPGASRACSPNAAQALGSASRVRAEAGTAPVPRGQFTLRTPPARSPLLLSFPFWGRRLPSAPASVSQRGIVPGSVSWPPLAATCPTSGSRCPAPTPAPAHLPPACPPSPHLFPEQLSLGPRRPHAGTAARLVKGRTGVSSRPVPPERPSQIPFLRPPRAVPARCRFRRPGTGATLGHGRGTPDRPG